MKGKGDMRQLLFAAVIAAVIAGAAATVQAQGCGLCYVNGFMDIPSPTQITTVAPGQPFGMTGWGYFCYDGQGIDRLDVFWFDDQGVGHQIPADAIHQQQFDRPDVRQAFVVSCPNIWWSTNTGWWFAVDYGYIPVGTHIVGVNIWHGPYRFQPNGPWQPSFTRTVVVQ